MKFKKIVLTAALSSTVSLMTAISADSTVLSGSRLLQQADQNSTHSTVSPIRRIKRNRSHHQSQNQLEFRTIDGSDNNIQNPDMNVADSQLIRLVPSDYGNDVSELSGVFRPGPREISNQVLEQNQLVFADKRATDFLWQWGQFLDHDIDLTDGVDSPEPANIPIPTGDFHFDPGGIGGVELPFNRSIYDIHSGTSHINPRQQINEISGWIDASNVYGSNSGRAAALRTLDGTGKLKESAKRLLPFNTGGLENAGGEDVSLFLAGDVRANEQVGLTAMHTLFVREHNRLAKNIAKGNPGFTGEEIYQKARNKVGALMQVITFNEFLPVLLGPNALPIYNTYNPGVNAGIANEFSTVAFRFGHSLLSPQLLRLKKNGKVTKFGHLALRDAFFSPNKIIDEGGIEPILRGLANQACQNLDVLIIDDVRNFLFGEPGNGGFDLASLNIQRGRDHGIPSYNETRMALGFDAATTFQDISSDVEIQQKLAAGYSSVDDIDLWVGGLAEDHVEDALVGEVFFYILMDQFQRLRDGDRFWYENNFQGDELDSLNSTTLADVIRRNSKIGKEIQNNVFILENE